MVFSVLHTSAEDWPQWRGPDRNNISKETEWTDEWTDGKPKEVWRSEVQLGFGSMVVGNGRLFTMGHDGEETVTLFCLDSKTGKRIWKHSWQSDLGDKYFEGGGGNHTHRQRTPSLCPWTLGEGFLHEG